METTALYIGWRQHGKTHVKRIRGNTVSDLPHSGVSPPSAYVEYDWGKLSVAAYQLGAAICRDMLLENNDAEQIFSEFTEGVVVYFPLHGFILTEEEAKHAICGFGTDLSKTDGEPQWRYTVLETEVSRKDGLS